MFAELNEINAPGAITAVYMVSVISYISWHFVTAARLTREAREKFPNESKRNTNFFMRPGLFFLWIRKNEELRAMQKAYAKKRFPRVLAATLGPTMFAVGLMYFFGSQQS